MNLKDWMLLVHPALAVILIYPLVGIVLHFAWQTRQRRLHDSGTDKPKKPVTVAIDHVQFGRYLTGVVVVVTLVALVYSIVFKNIVPNNLWQTNQFLFIFILSMVVATVATLTLLYQARENYWRAIFAVLTGVGLVILGSQDGVFRRDNEWFISHYYYGITASLLMVFSLAIIPDIYQDRTNRWRYLHVIFNCFAVLLFVGQAITGTRDIFNIGQYTPPPAFILSSFSLLF
ncbi:MAG: DUF4079 domain-containing protein [Synechococcales bacterium]|nr:DUF4079 family protein [Cyanobacteria bacterium REEB444]MEB3124482.1 DUF4079 domain-containing protein [Synechococcales bacterium]